MFSYYVASGNTEKAREYINLAMQNDPNNAQFLVIRGTLAQEMKDKTAAEADFNKALEIDPNNYDAIYGLGALYINSAADTLEWADKNIPPTDFAAFEKYQEIAKECQTKALPHLEKALSIKPNDLQVLQILKELYYKAGKYEESQQMGARIKELTE
jgi:tetratricopeptide (TPR) repeat protein